MGGKEQKGAVQQVRMRPGGALHIWLIENEHTWIAIMPAHACTRMCIHTTCKSLMI